MKELNYKNIITLIREDSSEFIGAVTEDVIPLIAVKNEVWYWAKLDETFFTIINTPSKALLNLVNNALADNTKVYQFETRTALLQWLSKF